MNPIFAASAISLLLSISAHASNEPGANTESRIRYKPGWVEATCELHKLDFLEAEKRRDERREFFDRPYPAELENYAPKSFEYAEHLLTGVPCFDEPPPELKLPTGFRCRLDRMIFRDLESGKELKAEGGNYEFVFVYLDPDEEKPETQPRPLKEEGPTLVGWVSVRGQLDGKSYTIVRHWMDGSPAESTASRETNPQGPDDAILPPGELPFVTKANASMFVIDLKNDMPIVKELSGGPLKEFQFIPYGCRS
jgi:hypothetical protein